MRGPARNGDSDASAVNGMSGSHGRTAGAPPKKMTYDTAYDGSGNDAEASSDALWHEDVPLRTRRSRRELAQPAREARKTPMERRRSSGRRSGTIPSLSLSRADVDEYAVDDEPQDARIRRGRAVVPQTSSLMRAIAEACLFVGLACGVAYKMYAQGNEEVRAKLPELVFLTLLSLTCFVTHLNTTCTMWATRVRYLRKTDMSDPLYALLVIPLLSSVYLLDAVPRDGRGPFSPLRMSLEPDAEWRAALLPSIGPTYYDDHAQVTRDRCAMLDTHVIFGTVIGIHILATTWHRRQSKRQGKHMQIENMPAFTAFAYYVAFALGVTALIGAVKIALYFFGQSRLLFGTLSIWETMVDALLFQCSVYAWTRIARQNCTLGELSMACFFNTTLLLEAVYLTFSKLGTPSVVKTFRTPSVLLAYQLALVTGMLLVGLFLSPLLALSRVLAQRPTHRLRWPDKRNLHRRLLALAFFLFSALLIIGTLGPWVWWMLGRRNPWLYVARFMLQGRYWWSRIALLVYWGILCNIALLSLQLMVNRVWQYATVGDQVQAQAMKRRAAARAETTSAAKTMPTTSERAGTLAASRFAAPHAEGERTSLGPALAVTVNGRRKFFHVLAVFLFIPGIAWDPAFMYLGFSVAFSLFIFCEYLRYCAVYPVGASLHFFLSQFLDSKDSGLVILSHIYLLSGCAAGLWMESRSALLQQLGLLVLGIGDSCASIVGHRYGRVHWPHSSKTIEGTVAFFGSVVLSAFVLRMLRMVEAFDVLNLTIISVFLAIVEGISEQNDNLVLPVLGLVLGSLFPVS